jgi:hypothetical protein
MSTISTALELMVGIFTLVSCFLYIVETYAPDSDTAGLEDCGNTHFFLAESILSTGFAFHFILYLYLAPERSSYLLSLNSLVDVLTIVPVYLAIFVKIQCDGSMSNSFKFVRVVRLLRVLRSLSLLAGGTAANPIVYQMVVTISTMAVILVFTAGIVHFMQNPFWGGEDNSETWNSERTLTFADAL